MNFIKVNEIPMLKGSASHFFFFHDIYVTENQLRELIFCAAKDVLTSSRMLDARTSRMFLNTASVALLVCFSLLLVTQRFLLPLMLTKISYQPFRDVEGQARSYLRKLRTAA